MKSHYFSKLALRALNRMGNIMLPANGEFPSFEEYGGLEYIDNIAAFAPKDDINLLNIVFSILGVMPKFILKWLVKKMAVSNESSSFFAPILRQLNVGVRGLIFSCYYCDRSGKDFKGIDPMEIMGYKLNRVID